LLSSRISKKSRGGSDTEYIQVMSAQDVPFIPLWTMTDEMVIATLPGVHGATVNITMDIQLWNIYKD